MLTTTKEDSMTNHQVHSQDSLRSRPGPPIPISTRSEEGMIGHYYNITSVDFHQAQHSVQWKILDIRTKPEFQRGHLPGAILFPAEEFSPQAFRNHRLEKNDYILIYCNTGVRSLPPSEILVRQGYKNVFNLLDGIAGWPFYIQQ